MIMRRSCILLSEPADQRFFKPATRTDRPFRLACAAGLGVVAPALCGACAVSPADAGGSTAAAATAAARPWRRDLPASFAEETSVARACAAVAAPRADE